MQITRRNQIGFLLVRRPLLICLLQFSVKKQRERYNQSVF